MRATLLTTADTARPEPPENLSHQAASATCDPHGGCRWQPSTTSASTSGSFQAYAAIIVIILLCAVICALALSGAIRCFRRRRAPPPQLSHELGSPKQAARSSLVLPSASPPVVFSPGMEMAGAAAECAICLTEFVAGDEIRVMGECRHGFHVDCIERWLCSQSSCPTCRRNCLAALPEHQQDNPPTTTATTIEPAGNFLVLSTPL